MSDFTTNHEKIWGNNLNFICISGLFYWSWISTLRPMDLCWRGPLIPGSQEVLCQPQRIWCYDFASDMSGRFVFVTHITLPRKKQFVGRNLIAYLTLQILPVSYGDMLAKDHLPGCFMTWWKEELTFWPAASTHIPISCEFVYATKDFCLNVRFLKHIHHIDCKAIFCDKSAKPHGCS